MSKARTVSIKLDDREAAALEFLHENIGIRSTSELLRWLISREARERGWAPGAELAAAPVRAGGSGTDSTGTEG